jgi:tRNA C32,U32 (ribose-2'-O)-methylase TrmJ
MTEAEAKCREQVKQLIAQIEASGKSLYYISLQMSRQYTQIERMKKSGRCQKYEYDMLIEILKDVSHGTLQNVTMPFTQT